MYFLKPRARKTASLLLVLILTCSLMIALPQSADASASTVAAQKRKTSKKTSKKKTTARSRSSKSKASKARKGRTASRRSRSSRSRKWRGKAANTTPTYSSSPIHEYLTDAWTKPATKTTRTAANAETDQALTPPASQADQPLTPTLVHSTNGNGASVATGSVPASPDGVTEDTEPINPLVFAYAESLAARGFKPDNQGFIVTTMNGEVLAEHNADVNFNPASVVKIATSLTAISKLGPDFRFRTSIYTDGALDTSTGTLKGSLYLIGSGDPAFFLENALMIVDKLNRSGIHSVEGNLYVLGPFYYNFSTSREATARAFKTAITTDEWTSAMKAAYPNFLAMRSAVERQSGKQQVYIPASYRPDAPPHLKISGETITSAEVNTSGLKPLAVHTSLPLVRVLKALNDFSNNWMAHVIGSMVGGPDAVTRFLTTEVGLKEEEVSLATSSGLGANAISPRNTIVILRKLINYLNNRNLKVEEILPIAGIDAGTLKRRFTDAFRGSVVAKTGTLNSVSALAGVAYTRSKGPLLFVIYNRGGSPARFRTAQDETLKKLITLYGGPAPVHYAPPMDIEVSDGKTPSMSSPK